jgi:septal ring factor EnvC (AmiA/AmiB activator)
MSNKIAINILESEKLVYEKKEKKLQKQLGEVLQQAQRLEAMRLGLIDDIKHVQGQITGTENNIEKLKPKKKPQQPKDLNLAED